MLPRFRPIVGLSRTYDEFDNVITAIGEALDAHPTASRIRDLLASDELGYDSVNRLLRSVGKKEEDVEGRTEAEVKEVEAAEAAAEAAAGAVAAAAAEAAVDAPTAREDGVHKGGRAGVGG